MQNYTLNEIEALASWASRYFKKPLGMGNAEYQRFIFDQLHYKGHTLHGQAQKLHNIKAMCGVGFDLSAMILDDIDDAWLETRKCTGATEINMAFLQTKLQSIGFDSEKINTELQGFHEIKTEDGRRLVHTFTI